MSNAHVEHGSMQAYVTGFILSLIFTFIPYYLVTEKVVTGNALLLTILGFGLIQMLVQITFFLHLGRGPKPNWQIYFFLGTIGTILIVVGGTVVIIHNLHYNMTPTDQVMRLTNDEGIYQVNGKKTGACEGVHPNHQIIIKNGVANPFLTDAKQCDTLTFTNQSTEAVEVTFGTDQTQTNTSYAGVANYSVGKNMNKTITLSELGLYTFQDAKRPATSGAFNVSQ